MANGQLDGADIAQLEAAHGAAIRRVAARILGDSSEAEDVCAETMVAAWQRAADLRNPDAMRPWLLAIARHRALDRLRRRRPATDIEHASGISGPLTPNIEARLDLWSAIGRLSPARSAAIALRYLADLSIEQIGAKLEVSSNTVKTNLRLGLIDLRRLLAAPGSTHARAQEQEVSAMDNISDEQAEQDWDLLAAAAERMVDDEWAFIEGLALEFLQAQQVELDRSEIMADVRSAALRAGRNYASGDFGDEQFRTVVAYPVMNVLRICAALTRLPADQAAAIRLRYGLVGRSASLTGNMAAELHISVAQARALVYEAETQLARDPAVQTALLATAIRPQAPAGWALDPAQDL